MSEIFGANAVDVNEIIKVNLEDLEAELEKALNAEDHNLAREIKQLAEFLIIYDKEVTDLHELNDDLIKNSENLASANKDLMTSLREIFLILNSERKKALKINGMKEILDVLGTLVTSSSMVKASVE